jgi:LAS superfamily LD-carboxypeptidase LdcB
MKIGNRNKIIIKIIITLLIIILPISAGIVVFSEYMNSKDCKEQVKTIEAIDLPNKPVIICEKNLINLNLLANKMKQETNNLNVTNFENQNKDKKELISQELASLQKFLSDSKINYKLPISNSFINLTSNYHTLVRDNKDKINEATNLKNQLDSNMSLLNDEDQKTAKEIISMKGLTFISQNLKTKELIDKQITQLLATRNNKASITDQDYLELKKKLKVFNAAEFLALSDSISTIPRPTWNKTIIAPEVDANLYNIASKRGYKYRIEADVSKLTGVMETDINIDAKGELDKLIDNGAKDGNNFKIASGYRNPDLQKIVFTGRLATACSTILGRDCILDDFRNGTANAPIEEVLKTSSVPAMSKHHTGLTADINEVNGGALTEFKNTKSYQYLSADNFFNAKRFGFVPSYPNGGKDMGPDPEEWEFVYVGIDKLLNK